MGAIEVLEKAGLGCLLGTGVGILGTLVTGNSLTVGGILYGLAVGLVVGFILGLLYERE